MDDCSFLRVTCAPSNQEHPRHVHTRISGFSDHVRSPPDYMKQRAINFRVTTRRKRVSVAEHERRRRRRRRGAGKAAVTFLTKHGIDEHFR